MVGSAEEFCMWLLKTGLYNATERQKVKEISITIKTDSNISS